MKALIVILSVLALAAAGGGWYWQHSSKPNITFRTTEVKRGELLATISATGTIEPSDVIDVGAQVAGKIDTFGKDANGKPVDYGSEVTEGTELAHIDESIPQADLKNALAQLSQAKATLEHSKADLERLKALSEQADDAWKRVESHPHSEALAQNDYETFKANAATARANLEVGKAAILEAQAGVEQADAQLPRARANVQYCHIMCPVNGVIIDRRVNIGQTVVAGLSAPSLFLIAQDLRNMQLWVAVNEADVGSIHPGQSVTFTVDAFPGESFKGTVNKIRLNATMTQNVVTYTVEVNTDNRSLRLMPYLTANVQFEVKKDENVLLVPNSALRWFPQPQSVAPDVRAQVEKADSKEPGAEAPAASPAAPAAPSASPAGTDGPTTRPHRKRKNDTEKSGTIWVQDGLYVRPVTVTVGPTDTVNTEVASADLKEGAAVIIGEIHEDDASSQTTNPFAPQDIPSRWQGWREGQVMELIRLEDIYKTYHLGEVDVPVLRGISLEIGRGELVSLMGASGSGKSTLMNILGCLDRPSSGEYWLDGQEISRLDADGRAMVRNQKIGFVFQSFNLLPRTSAIENVMMPLTYTARHLSEKQARKRGEDLLNLVGLGDRMDHEPSQLSGGQQQHVAIARSLVNHPPLLFADEPTGNLDSHTSEDVLKMFQKLNSEEGITIILVTHDANVARHSNRVIRIKDGIVENDHATIVPSEDINAPAVMVH